MYFHKKTDAFTWAAIKKSTVVIRYLGLKWACIYQAAEDCFLYCKCWKRCESLDCTVLCSQIWGRSSQDTWSHYVLRQHQRRCEILTSCQLSSFINLFRSSGFPSSIVSHCIRKRGQRRHKTPNITFSLTWLSCVCVCACLCTIPQWPPSPLCGDFLLWCGKRSGGPVREVPPSPEWSTVALREGRAQREGGLPAGRPASPPLPGGSGWRTPPLTAQQPAVCR